MKISKDCIINDTKVIERYTAISMGTEPVIVIFLRIGASSNYHRYVIV